MPEEKLKEIEENFEKSKNIIEQIELLMKDEEVKYNVHIERLQSLRFVYQRLVSLKELELAEWNRSLAEQQTAAQREEAWEQPDSAQDSEDVENL